MINISINDKKTGLKKELKIKKTTSGDYILNEHPDLDIVVMPEKTKILIISKSDNYDMTYRLQDKIFKHLCERGVVPHESIKGGNIYGSMEATFPQTSKDGQSGLMVALYSIGQYLEDQRPEFKAMLKHKKDLEDSLLNPSIKDSTELGEVPQERFKGSIPKYGFPTRGIYRYNY